MNKYFVIAIKWDDDKQKQVEYIVGTFDDFICAKLFKDAYNKFTIQMQELKILQHY